jgi:hypothetical protein
MRSRAWHIVDGIQGRYVAVRSWEIEKERAAVTKWERRRYFEQV